MSNTILNAGPSPRHGGGFIGGGSGSEDTTWLVYIRDVGTSGSPQWKAGVSINSPLQGDDPNDIRIPEGALSSRKLSDPDTTGFMDTGVDDFIFAELEFDYTNTDAPFTIGGFSIKSNFTGADFKGRGIYINLSGDDSSPQYVQWKLCIPVARIAANPDIAEPTPFVQVRYLKTPIRLIARSFTMYDSDGEEPTDVRGMDYEA